MPLSIRFRISCLVVLLTSIVCSSQHFSVEHHQTTDKRLLLILPSVLVRQKQLPSTNHVFLFRDTGGTTEVSVKFYTDIEASEITGQKLLSRAETATARKKLNNTATIQEETKGIKQVLIPLNSGRGKVANVLYAYYTNAKLLYEISFVQYQESDVWNNTESCIGSTRIKNPTSNEQPGIPGQPGDANKAPGTGSNTFEVTPTRGESPKNTSSEEVFWTPLKLGLVIGGGALLVISLGVMILMRILKAGKSKDDDDDRPRKKKRPRYDDEDDLPRKKKKVDYDDDEEDRPKAKSKKVKETFGDDEDEDDDPPPRKPAPKPTSKGPPKPPPPKPKR